MSHILKFKPKEYDADALYKIANFKRFLECLKGDASFESSLVDEKANPEKIFEILKQREIDIDPYLVLPVWENGLDDVDIESIKLEGEYPLFELWQEWRRDSEKANDALVKLAKEGCPNDDFVRWRERQNLRANSELGDFDKLIPHLSVAFELSQGCSVGCWFCGVSAKSFKGYVSYTKENALLWRDILSIYKESFGDLLQLGFCYWATEPTDNPDYIKFLKDYQSISNILPQTTLSQPLKDIGWTSELMELHDIENMVRCRFSVLDIETLHKLHKIFSPLELLNVPLVIQSNKNNMGKSTAGRMRKSPKKIKSRSDIGTIACVSGFLINIFEKSIKLVSPCPSSDEWPLGYRVYAQEGFTDASDFRVKLLKIVENCMVEESEKYRVLCFREDLIYESSDTGFSVRNRFKKYNFQGKIPWKIAGELINSKEYNKNSIIDKMQERGVDIISAISTVETVFKKGLIEDETVKTKRG